MSDCIPPPSEKVSAKPATQNAIRPMPIMASIFATTLPTFFIREKPTSSIAKPACIKSTSTAATTTHMVSRASATSSVVAAPCVTSVSWANAAAGIATISSNTIIPNITSLRKTSLLLGTDMYESNIVYVRSSKGSLAQCINMGSARGCELILPVGKRRPEASLVSAVREARGLLRGATKELHGLYAQGEALAVLALVHVEVGELLYAV